MDDCSSKAGDEDLKAFLQHLMTDGRFAGAVVIASKECPVHGIDVEQVVCGRDVPSKRDHLRKLIEHIRGYADTLEAHYLGGQLHEPVKQSYGPHN